MQTKKKKNWRTEGLMSLVPVAQAGLTTKASQAPGVARGDVFEMAIKFINFAIMAIGVLGVIIFIYAGFLYLTASGDEAKITKAKNTMTWAIVGIVVSVLGYVVVRTVAQWIVGQQG